MNEINSMIGEGFTSLKVLLNNKTYTIKVIDAAGIIVVNDIWYKTDSFQEFFDIFRNICDKYNVKRVLYSSYSDNSAYECFENVCIVSGNSSMNLVLNNFSSSKIDNNEQTINDWIKMNYKIEMNQVIEYENLTFKIIEINEGNVIALLMKINDK